MPRDPKLYLYEMLAACQRIEEFTAGMSFGQYLESSLIQSGVERQFEILGEALNQLRHNTPTLAESVPEGVKIVRFRNILIHAYFSIDHEIVWSTIQQDLPGLRHFLQQQLTALES